MDTMYYIVLLMLQTDMGQPQAVIVSKSTMTQADCHVISAPALAQGAPVGYEMQGLCLTKAQVDGKLKRAYCKFTNTADIYNFYSCDP